MSRGYPQRVTERDAEAAREPPICASITPPGCARWRALNDHSVLNARMTFQAADTPAKQLHYAREWSSLMCAFPVSGQPPTIIFCVQGATRAADRTPQQRRGM